MKQFKSALLLVAVVAAPVLVVPFGATAMAVTLYSPPAYVGGVGNPGTTGQILCSVANVSSQTLTVGVLIFDSSGSKGGINPGPVPPGQVLSTGLGSTGAPMWCQITVEGGSASMVRGSLQEFDANGVPAGLAAALPISATCNGDANGDGQVTVNEILDAVNNALNGCPAN